MTYFNPFKNNVGQKCCLRCRKVTFNYTFPVLFNNELQKNASINKIMSEIFSLYITYSCEYMLIRTYKLDY